MWCISTPSSVLVVRMYLCVCVYERNCTKRNKSKSFWILPRAQETFRMKCERNTIKDGPRISHSPSLVLREWKYVEFFFAVRYFNIQCFCDLPPLHCSLHSTWTMKGAHLQNYTHINLHTHTHMYIQFIQTSVREICAACSRTRTRKSSTHDALLQFQSQFTTQFKSSCRINLCSNFHYFSIFVSDFFPCSFGSSSCTCALCKIVTAKLLYMCKFTLLF